MYSPGNRKFQRDFVDLNDFNFVKIFPPAILRSFADYWKKHWKSTNKLHDIAYPTRRAKSQNFVRKSG